MPEPKHAQSTPETNPFPEPKLAALPCAEKERLKTELRTAMDEIIALNVRQMEAARKAELEAGEFLKHQVDYVRRRKDSLLELYKAHACRHGC